MADKTSKNKPDPNDAESDIDAGRQPGQGYLNHVNAAGNAAVRDKNFGNESSRNEALSKYKSAFGEYPVGVGVRDYNEPSDPKKYGR